jgi:hypothetical protein
VLNLFHLLSELLVPLLPNTHFLPVYQKILLMILLAKRIPAEDLLARINDELTPLGIRLENPKPDSVWYK